MTPTRRYLTTAEAAEYCGYDSASALRQAKRRGLVRPVGRRGGVGPLMWSVDALDAFLRGEGLTTVLDASAAGHASEEVQNDNVDKQVELVGIGQANRERRVASTRRRVLREGFDDGSKNGSREGGAEESTGCENSAGGEGNTGRHSRNHKKRKCHSAEVESSILRIRRALCGGT